MNKAVDFVKKQIDEFEERIFGKRKKSRLKKNDSEIPKIENLSSKEFTTEPFGKDGQLKPNIKYREIEREKALKKVPPDNILI